METTITPSSCPGGRTPEEVWAAIEDSEEYQRETAERLEKQLIELSSPFSEWVDYMFRSNLFFKFQTFGFDFTEFFRERTMCGEDRVIATADAVLKNSDKVMIIEIRSKPDIDDIKDHIERMEKIRSYVDKKGDRRKYYAAMGGMIYDDNVRNYALKSGLYIIEPSGNTFDIVAPKGEYQPREW